jgi:hypothetical protein
MSYFFKYIESFPINYQVRIRNLEPSDDLLS